MNLKTYSAHGAHFLTIEDPATHRETTILRTDEREPLADTLERYLRDERHAKRSVESRIAFYEQARKLVV